MFHNAIQIDGYMKPSLRNFLKDRYVGGNGTDVLSLAFDFFMSGVRMN